MHFFFIRENNNMNRVSKVEVTKITKTYQNHSFGLYQI